MGKMETKKLVRFDWAIKYLLRNKANFDVLEGFLSNLLKEEIKVENILESESNREQENRKFNRVDLMCYDASGRQIIIEIQNQREVDYLHRLLWGTSKVIVESLELGGRYGEVVKVISMGEKERRAYDDYLAYLAQERDILDTAKEEGEKNAKIEIAREMMREGDSFEKIARITKLPLATIQELAQSIR
jgi:hypothetical protein